MLGIMDGKGKRGRPNREWIDDIKEWCKKICTDWLLSERDQKLWKQRNLRWTPTGFQPMDHDDEDE